MSDKTPNLDSLFEAALQIESADERAVFLDQSCGNNQELRNQVERLLQSDEQAGSFLNKAAVEAEATSIGQSHGDLAASIEAGFVQTFGTNEAVVLGDPGHSVLKSLGLTVDNVPRVVLRESAEERADPILRPASPEMPQNDSDSRYRLDGEIARGGMGAILKGRDVDLGRELAIKVRAKSRRSTIRGKIHAKSRRSTIRRQNPRQNPDGLRFQGLAFYVNVSILTERGDTG